MATFLFSMSQIRVYDHAVYTIRNAGVPFYNGGIHRELDARRLIAAYCSLEHLAGLPEGEVCNKMLRKQRRVVALRMAAYAKRWPLLD